VGDNRGRWCVDFRYRWMVGSIEIELVVVLLGISVNVFEVMIIVVVVVVIIITVVVDCCCRFGNERSR
jgi:hypothetical protein